MNRPDPLTEQSILRWADAHHRRTGQWPGQRSGPVDGQGKLTWARLQDALRQGFRGLPGGSSIAQLLDRERGVENYLNPRPVTIEEIVWWAQAHRMRTGQWPHKRSGSVTEAQNLTWATLNIALRCGSRGLPSGTSLATVLEKHAQARTRRNVPKSSVRTILRWVDEHRRRTGRWPNVHSGDVTGVDQESWLAIDKSLRVGTRGLPGGSSLSRLLLKHRLPQLLRDARRGGRSSPAQLLRIPRPRESPPAIENILESMDEYHERAGRWPDVYSGRVKQSPLWTWAALNDALRHERSLSPARYGSLLGLLRRERGVWDARGLPVLSKELVSSWAQAHFERTGRWPYRLSGKVPEWRGETWARITAAFANGSRGLSKGKTLNEFLMPMRIALGDPRVRRFKVQDVLAWADEHKMRTGDWPRAGSGVVRGEPTLTWQAVDGMLVKGRRGLPRGMSVVRLLAKHRGRRNLLALPRFTIAGILRWADSHKARTGDWPMADMTPVGAAPGENWKSVDGALANGIRGLRGGTTLNRLLAKHRGKRDNRNPPSLTLKQVHLWVKAFRAKHQRWPHPESGKIDGVEGESWWTVSKALQHNRRGLRYRATLKKFLVRECGMYTRQHRPPLTAAKILGWADAMYAKTGTWPSKQSGRVPGTEFESWHSVEVALKSGTRGLSDRTSLFKFLLLHRGAAFRRHGYPLSIEDILEWAADHHEQIGRLPAIAAGPVRGQDGETWLAIDAALRTGERNLRGGSSLPRLLASRYVEAYPGIGQRLSEEKIVEWARAFRKRAGAWPTKDSAYVLPPRRDAPERQGERWLTIDMALREGLRGLPGGSSLRELLKSARKK